MKRLIVILCVGFFAIPSLASQNLSCVASEAGMDLQYVTSIANLTEKSADSLEIGFATKESGYQIFCVSEEGIQVSALSDDILVILAQVNCVDGTKKQLEVKLNLVTMELDSGVRIQKCSAK